ncbi:RmlC-like cupin domain-containing protein [Scenedesmus sp. NREL 46B-D3]|nr:RmlC-like cupin domain-containing protein [Scenedesmus sp. NREL 46B-D3]
MLSLRCPAQNYAWGRPAEKSEVAKLAGLNGSIIDESKPFAELWMGTHPSGPAVISGQDTTLKQWIEAHPEALGDAVLKRFGTDLPYLFKVLSVQTALSIQSHPDKKLAERLHAQQPQDYKDDNHKPEMALALEDFEALCGFVSSAELKEQLRQQPELRLCVGEEAVSAILQAEGEQAKSALKAAFTALMTCDAEKVAGAIDTMVQRLSQDAAGARALSEKEALVLRLNQQYPNDVGVLSAYFLNQVRLAPGEAIFLAANEPHAYVSGELVECMAASDNVIRAGLTPKFRDTAVLCESLTYNTGTPEVLTGQRVHDHVKAYRPPFDEFEIQHIEVPAGESVAVPTNPGPLLLLVHAGAGAAKAAEGSTVKDGALQQQAELHRGSIVFVPAGTSLTYDASAAGPLQIWVAAVNAKVFAAPVEAPAEAAEAPAEAVEAVKERVLVA